MLRGNISLLNIPNGASCLFFEEYQCPKPKSRNLKFLKLKTISFQKMVFVSCNRRGGWRNWKILRAILNRWSFVGALTCFEGNSKRFPRNVGAVAGYISYIIWRISIWILTNLSVNFKNFYYVSYMCLFGYDILELWHIICKSWL